MVRDILYIVIPNEVENSMFQLEKIMLLSIVAEFGITLITANAVENSISLFEVLLGAAVGLGTIKVSKLLHFMALISTSFGH